MLLKDKIRDEKRKVEQTNKEFSKAESVLGQDKRKFEEKQAEFAKHKKDLLAEEAHL